MERTLGFLEEVFGRFYAANPLPPPVELPRREIAFTFHGQTFMRRHQGFDTAERLAAEMRKRAPANVYHSTAYYEHPNRSKMVEKNWLRADLVFDLDADHLKDADKMSYAEQLRSVKPMFVKLVDTFLVDHLGYEERDLHLFFSGSRGYHCHIRDPRVQRLKSQERRRLVDYIAGTFDVELLFTPIVDRAATGNRFHSFGVPTRDDGAWRGYLAESVYAKLEGLSRSTEAPSVIAKSLEADGLDAKQARGLVAALNEARPELREDRLRRLQKGFADLDRSIRPDTFKPLFVQAHAAQRGWFDEPVTSDTHRLIRAPGSLHGKTGLRAVPLTRNQLDAFEPLVEAVVLDDEPTEVNAAPNAKPFTLAGQEFKPTPGPNTLPRYAAVFLILRRQALLPGDTPPPPPAPKPAPAATGGTA